MSRHHSHLASAEKILTTLKPGEPLMHHLKRFFAADKKFGSKDRRSITQLCYQYFRVGRAMKGLPVAEKIINSAFLSTHPDADFINAVAPERINSINKSTEQKLALLKISSDEIFPFADETSKELDSTLFINSFLLQPKVFLRLRPGREIKLLEKLTESNIPFEEISTSCIALQASSKASDLIKTDRVAVVQDLSSQQVFDYLKADGIFLPPDPVVWDCCAASGGKSILIYDLLHGKLDLHVSDIRSNILQNLDNRFKDAGIKKYDTFVADLSSPFKIKSDLKFDVIICDAPCTGSGTWSRTPEQLAFFEPNMITKYADLQKGIAVNALEHLKPGGLFFYITCSVFEKENENIVEHLKSLTGVTVLNMRYIKGYSDQADTMFVAVLTK